MDATSRRRKVAAIRRRWTGKAYCVSAAAVQQGQARASVGSGGLGTRSPCPQEPTFREATAVVIDLHAETWRNAAKSRRQWEHSLSAYAFPVIGGMKLSAIKTSDVLYCLMPIWNDKRETAMRVRQRIRAVMQWAIASGYRTDTPAGDVLQAALPKREARRRKHHAALPHSAVAGAIAKVRASKSQRSTIAAFEFLVLTACRSGEVRNARWRGVVARANRLERR